VTDDDRTRREVHGLSVEIDRDLCVGFGDCVDASPEAFELDGEDVAVFTCPENVSRDELLRACRSCPVDAITARDADGDVLAP
jgi:ferredoxin